jgi:hypothetical protein
MRVMVISAAVRWDWGVIPAVNYDQRGATSFGDYANDCYPGGLVDVVWTLRIGMGGGGRDMQVKQFVD